MRTYLIKIGSEKCPDGNGRPTEASQWEGGRFTVKRSKMSNPVAGDEVFVWVMESRDSRGKQRTPGLGLTARMKVESCTPEGADVAIRGRSVELLGSPHVGMDTARDAPPESILRRIHIYSPERMYELSAHDLRALENARRDQRSQPFSYASVENRARQPSPGGLTAEEIKQLLKARGFDETPGLKVMAMTHFALRSPLYLKAEGHPLVVEPFLIQSTPELMDIPGVKPGESFYHNSNMNGFPKHIHKGKTEIHYGAQFAFETSRALNFFADALLGSSVSFGRNVQGLSITADDLSLIPKTERDALIQARLGQDRFRASLLNYWGGCAVTGVRVPEMLRASHIKPWHKSDGTERLNPFNGLLLAPNLDQAFDRGLISFGAEGGIIISGLLPERDAQVLGIHKGMCLRKAAPEHLSFLDWHRTHELKST